MSGPELAEVEQPFLDQLALMGWKVVTGSLDHPSVTGRESFREVFMNADLRRAIERINLRDGKPWLDEGRVSQAVSALERIGHKKLIQANQEATELLLQGVQVEGLPGWDGGRSRTIHFIDWEHPENNTFTAVNQFKVDYQPRWKLPRKILKTFEQPASRQTDKRSWPAPRAQSPPRTPSPHALESPAVPFGWNATTS